MMRGLYDAAAAMFGEIIKQDTHANNLANVDTLGFKRCLTHMVQRNDAQQMVSVVGGVDSRPGPIRATEGPLDVALRSKGYFVVQSGNGRQYTRNGQFQLDGTGTLVDLRGRSVLGLNGPIRLTGSDVQIADNGGVYSDGAFVDKLMIVDFAPGTALVRDEAGAMAAIVAPTPVGQVSLVQGALEGSNVTAVEELMEMMAGYRVYEANAQVIGQTDKSLQAMIQAATG